MSNRKIFNTCAPFFFLILLLLDGQITRGFLAIYKGNFSMTSHTLILLMLLYIPHTTQTKSIVYALIIGVISDLYYLGILGIASFGLPILMLLFCQLFKKIEENSFTVFLCYILAVILLESVSYILQTIFQLINGDLMYFITGILGPTIVLNIVLYAILIVPFRALYPIPRSVEAK